MKFKDEQNVDFENELLNFIRIKFLEPIKINGNKPTIRQYEDLTSIGRTTITKLTKSQGYDVPFSTIFKICKYAEIPLSDFFSQFEEYLRTKYSKK
ncbi:MULTISPECIES: hypothetical protein [Sphingobacterium]|jgi:hypothetical protein|uniref:HTH cro/C1-type domain-containing protein n=1 Tax=Sphingobacterium hotanense TaxID=649196 RepID=A0ABT7NJG6_9SPHI|nr:MULTISPECIES: hypothetical protein [Sphingobacterium]MDM1047340.1 hypothetical protein [Sphingobacterium hotanense]VTP87432.1 Uncharacterised protein [Sphingobacterium daejeonense]